MIIGQVGPEVVYRDHRFLRDLVAGRPEAVRCFRWRLSEVEQAAAERAGQEYPREKLVEAVGAYNRRLGAAPRAEDRIARLASPETVCVVGGQQAGFLGGPIYTLYKIRSILGLADLLTRRLGRDVVPIFWLASEDHDFDEINRVRHADGTGKLVVSTFESECRGAAIERLPISQEIARLAAERIAELPEPMRWFFTHEPGDDYASWHARIWSRMFSSRGLVLVEPRILRPLGGRWFDMARAETAAIETALEGAAEYLSSAGYDVPFDPHRAGRLFVIQDDGRRVRDERGTGGEPSPDAALRPVFADAILPTVAQVLGPGEIAYQAMLRPLYDLFGVVQPLVVPRQGYTMVSAEDADLLNRLGVSLDEVLGGGFDPGVALDRLADRELRDAFSGVRQRVEESLRPLADLVRGIDPGLEARYRQTAEKVDGEIERLADRASRAELGRRGISARRAQELVEAIRPTNRPQERVLSMFEMVRRHGIEWIDRLVWEESIDCAVHHVLTLEEET